MKKRALIAVALIAIASGAWIHIKAQLAQVLLRVAWHRQTKPWPWADTQPIARMVIGNRDFIVLEGANGRALAFAPGHLERTALPGERGNCVISAHRDTHFAALRDVRAGDVIRVQRADRRWVEYTVAEQHVVDEHDVWVTRSSDETTLTLVTCYPFDAIVAGGTQRYVVRAESMCRALSRKAGEGGDERSVSPGEGMSSHRRAGHPLTPIASLRSRSPSPAKRERVWHRQECLCHMAGTMPRCASPESITSTSPDRRTSSRAAARFTSTSSD